MSSFTRSVLSVCGGMRGDFAALGMQTSYETVLRDSSTFLGIKWETMIADEAHRFKSVSGQTRNIITRMSVRWKLLLTGKPWSIQSIAYPYHQRPFLAGNAMIKFIAPAGRAYCLEISCASLPDIWTCTETTVFGLGLHVDW